MGHYRHASERPLQWRFAGGLIFARFLVAFGSSLPQKNLNRVGPPLTKLSRSAHEAGLSKRYPNYCNRAMVATNLCDAGVSNIGIMSVSGHRNFQSFNTFIKPSDSERRAFWHFDWDK